MFIINWKQPKLFLNFDLSQKINYVVEIETSGIELKTLRYSTE